MYKGYTPYIKRKVDIMNWLGQAGVALTQKDYYEAFVAAGLNYKVNAEEVVSTSGVDIEGVHANIREDTQEFMGITSNKYGVIQNSLAFSMMQPFENLGMEYRRGGMTKNGLCFMVGELDDFEVLDDEFKMNVLGINSFNGRYPFMILLTPRRVVCENMFRGLMRGGSGGNQESMFQIRHGKNIAKTLNSLTEEQLKEKVGTFYADFIKTCEGLASQKVDVKVLDKFLETLYPYKDDDGVRNVKKWEKANFLRQKWLDTYYDVEDNQNFKGTRYGIMNAYYDYLSHPEKHGVNREGYEVRRFEKLMVGDGVNNKLMNIIKVA